MFKLPATAENNNIKVTIIADTINKFCSRITERSFEQSHRKTVAGVLIITFSLRTVGNYQLLQEFYALLEHLLVLNFTVSR